MYSKCSTNDGIIWGVCSGSEVPVHEVRDWWRLHRTRHSLHPLTQHHHWEGINNDCKVVFLCHCRGDNTLYKIWLILQFPHQKWCLKFEVMFEISKITFLAPKWPSLSLGPFIGPKKARAPLKVSRDHLESLKWPHLVIFRGWFDNAPPHLQHRDIDSYNCDPERRREEQNGRVQ